MSISLINITTNKLIKRFDDEDSAIDYVIAKGIKESKLVRDNQEELVITESIIGRYLTALKENASAGATGSSSIATGPAVKVEEEQVDELSPMAHRRYVDAVAQATDDSDDESNPFNDRPEWKNERTINKHFPKSVGKVLQRRVGESLEKFAFRAAKVGDAETFTEAMIAHHKEQFSKTGDKKHIAIVKEMRAARGREMLGELDNGPKGRVQTDKINYDKKHVGGHSADPAARRAEQQAASAERAKQRQANSRDQRAADAREADIDQWDVMDAIRSESGVGDPDHFVSYKSGFIDVGGVTVRAAKCRVMTAIDPVEHFGMMPDDPTVQGGPFEEILDFTVYRDPKNPKKLIVRNH